MVATWTSLPEDVALCIADYLDDVQIERLYHIHRTFFTLILRQRYGTVTLRDFTPSKGWLLSHLWYALSTVAAVFILKFV
jgi:hypothetical protein